MDSNLSPALAKRLAAYSAAAGITLALAPEADAQVVYHDIDPDVVIEENPPHDVLDLDFDDDGVTDLQLLDRDYTRYYYEREELYRAPGANTLNGALVRHRSSVFRFTTGEVIQAEPGDVFPRWGMLADVYGSRYPYCGKYVDGYFLGEEGYAGFRFVAGDGEVHYGWIRVAVTDCPMPLYTTAYEYAYEMTPETPIVAGVRSLAFLDGSVNQMSFPATGGTLAYTVTVENTTEDPLPLDLWLDADGPAVFTRRLGSGTLPPGATVTRTVQVQVPATAPAGDYDVRFKLGRFASERFITFERYAVTKEEGAGPTPAGSAEDFIAEPVSGDLFAGSEAAPEFVGTHALSVPVPNPSDGRTELTLRVAEAQHVSVTVHDALGREVVLLHEGVLASDQEHRLVFDGAELPVGVYVVRAVGEAFSDVRVLTLTR